MIWVSDEGSKHVADLLQRNTTITEVHLGGNGIGDKGAMALGTAMLNNNLSAVVDIRLTYNEIQILPQCFALLTSLNRLELKGNPLCDPPIALVNKGQAAIFSYLARQRKQICKIIFLLGFHKRVGVESSINLYLNRSSIYEPALLRCIFELF